MNPDDKRLLRARMRKVRAALAAADPSASDRAAERMPLDRLPAYSTFSGYRAAGSEMDPQPLMTRLLETGAVSTLPVATRGAPLAFRAWRPGEALAPDSFGVPAPLENATLVVPQLVICPLLAFDRAGGRLGQGGGHYDRALAALRATGPVFVLGLAYAGQEVEELALEAHDQRLDAILTETGYIVVG
ncbi:5-formyltetrahydrofolate cyclo-ligase [Phenylobacterium immobile]|uniref:5-formyltetrahydrofolate cyclo-ligase n=1 Tax=Phenylobacterium immobile TaxID=21 RepID=UPI000A7C9424|nr:5-formyltetrahydrofolate cyclo-ligase [Phenylobacterium immobile]